jgi:hypothetical protein
MRAKQLYALLDDAGVEYETVEMFEGVRHIRAVIEEEFETEESIKEKIADIIEYYTYPDDFGHVVFRDWGMVDDFIDRLMMEFKL